MPAHRTLRVRSETWPIAGAFRIARGSKEAAEVVVVEIAAGQLVGRGEAVPYARYGESVDATVATIEAQREAIEQGLGRAALQAALEAGAARNALDCALWDLEAQLRGTPAFSHTGLGPTAPVATAWTLSLAAPEVMAERAREQPSRRLLKLKLAGDARDVARVAAVRAAAPAARIIVDVNEAWTPAQYHANAVALAELGVALIEQPLPADNDQALEDGQRPVPVCADESCHLSGSLRELSRRYDLINVKLDKTGGLTEALRLVREAQQVGLGVMVGCMVSTSLAIAPALLLAPAAQLVDLDGAALLARDRDGGTRLAADGTLHPPSPGFWGEPPAPTGVVKRAGAAT